MNSIIYIIGVSGSGKTTIGKLLSSQTGIPFFDADDYHSIANKEKMKAGIPLTDEDRSGWLEDVNKLAQEQSKLKGAVIACSALKEKYRTLLSAKLIDHPVWVFLQGNYDLIHQRMEKRTDHYMPVNLLSSQLETLEIPANALTIDIKQKPEIIVTEITQHLKHY
jgi:carbohydrate kinase (thermoresistant glucokinase family)